MDNSLLSGLIESANTIYPDSPILAQVTVTQAILESGFINNPEGSVLANKYHNLFGIKGEGTHTPSSVELSTHEWYDGIMHQVKAEFAWNNDWADSFVQHKEFLEHPRYRGVLDAKSSPDAFQELHKAGYATDLNYSHELTQVWEKYVKNHYIIN